MIRLSRWSRTLWMLFAAGQFALPATLSVGDALASGDPRSVQSHVEDTSRSACQPAHAGDCAICRYLSALVSPAPAGATEFPHLQRDLLTGLGDVRIHSLRQQGFLSRAPPAWGA